MSGEYVEPEIVYATKRELERLRAIEEAAREVARLGNQPGFDDDEWELAITALEEALR